MGVLGSTGYGGAELIRLLLEHPRAHLVAAASRQHAGSAISEVLPALAGCDLYLDGDGVDPQAWRARGVEAVFACLPHGLFAGRAEPWLAAGIRVIDLSADFRPRPPEEGRGGDGTPAAAAPLRAEAAYGLSEWNRAEVARARLVANPGCYATALLLGMLPAAAAGWLGEAPIVVSAVSGISGAGRGLQLSSHFCEAAGSVAPYRVGERHNHLKEVGAALRRWGGGGPVVFSPHLAPMARGICASLALPLAQPRSPAEAAALYAARYADGPFVRVLAAGDLPETRFVRGSNRCDLAVDVAAHGRLLLVHACLDNLVKGAAGQALQNLNLMWGWPEATGLPQHAWACA